MGKRDLKRKETRGEYKKATDRRDKQIAVILSWLSRGFTESGAAAKAGISWTQYHKWKKEDDLFKADVVLAKEAGTQCLEDVAVLRGKRKSDVLLMFILKSRDERFKDKTQVNVQPVTVVARRYAP